MSQAETALQTAIRDVQDISDLPRDEWAEALEEFCEEHGYYEPLGDRFAAAFLDEKPRLLVSFDTFEQATERNDKGYPTGMMLAARHGWSSLTLMANDLDTKDRWFRSKNIYRYFDRLVDDGFFEDFDQVVFYGAGACGYAAAAYSVVAPGATVIAIAPQATLDGRLASWDRRFPKTRRMDFTSRYGFAPDMVDGAEKAFVLYDPRVSEDAMHAALFNRPHVNRIPCRLFGTDPEFEMLEMGALAPILEAAIDGRLDQRAVTRALRKRRDHLGYLRRLLAESAPKARPYQTALLCRHVLRNRKYAPRFRKAYDIALEVLEERNITLPELETPFQENA
ncbi:MAG: phosphoadenosine phosphosulfate reductase [Rhodobacteraceae bacterium]|nr:MAG: phosphoadenosine phosphosulfate reductase [Paracoccaceae bacterium]